MPNLLLQASGPFSGESIESQFRYSLKSVFFRHCLEIYENQTSLKIRIFVFESYNWNLRMYMQ